MFKNAVKAIFATVGLRLQNRSIVLDRRKIVGGMQYSTVTPLATYSPWLDDTDFIKIYDTVKSNTLVDRYRCFELWELVGQLAQVPGDILEVGVWRGGSGGLIAAKAKLMQIGKITYLCDTFSGVVKVSEKDTSYVGGEHSDTTEKHVADLISRLDVGDVRIKKGIFPDDFLSSMQECAFCFAHIDVDVYESARDIMDFVWQRMPVGGVIVFDDFGFDTCDGIARLVGEYRGSSDKIVIHNLNGHAILIKIE